MPAERATGGCLCGAVRYEVRGPVRDILVCHCSECRRWAGNAWAATQVARSDLRIEDESALRWVDSPESDRNARRGFCSRCGSSLFWKPAEGGRISIGAGTLDEPTGLVTIGHWYSHAPGDWYELPDDGLPRYVQGDASPPTAS
jgi:hypothetical protein